MGDRLTYGVQIGKKRFTYESEIDFNWLALFSCIVSADKISVEEALVTTGLLKHYKNKGDVVG